MQIKRSHPQSTQKSYPDQTILYKVGEFYKYQSRGEKQNVLLIL